MARPAVIARDYQGQIVRATRIRSGRESGHEPATVAAAHVFWLVSVPVSEADQKVMCV